MLLIDCGNTRLKWALTIDGVITESGHISFKDLNVDTLYQELCTKLFNDVLVASVKLSDKLDNLLALLADKAEKRIKVISHKDLKGRQFAYEKVECLGIDRCLVILAARELSPDGALIIDGGSAITADYVVSGGEHMGGYIFPGVRMLQDGLISGTSKIIVEDKVALGLSPGRDTETCVFNGVQVLINQALQFLITKSLEFDVSKVYIAGGDADYLSGLVEGSCEVRRDLVFEGMLLLAGGLFENEVNL